MLAYFLQKNEYFKMENFDHSISVWMLLNEFIIFIVQSLAYSTIYYIGPLSTLSLLGILVIDAFTASCILASYTVDNMFIDCKVCCCLMCQCLFAGSVYITHVHDSDVKSVIIRLVIILAYNFVFSFMMHLASCLDDAFKVCLKRLHYIKFKIVCWFSYVYIAIIAPLILITSIVFNMRKLSCINSEIAMSVIVGVISSFIYVLSGIVMLGSQKYNMENCKYDCTLALKMIQVASALAFIASTITNMVMLIIINSSYLIIIVSFTLVFVANIILLVGMLLVRDLISCCNICFLRRSQANQMEAPQAANQMEAPQAANQMEAPQAANQMEAPQAANQMEAPQAANQMEAPQAANAKPVSHAFPGRVIRF
jgi:hypothetical protein